MIYNKTLFVYLTLVVLQVQSFPFNLNRGEKPQVQRKVRGIKDWFAKTTTEASLPVTTTVKAPNHLELGHCEEDDKIIYIDDTRLEANNSTLGGVIEIYIDSPYHITCTKILDQMPSGQGAIPSYNSGGQGEKFIFINVQGQYGYGIHFRIIVRGNLKKSESEVKSTEA